MPEIVKVKVRYLAPLEQRGPLVPKLRLGHVERLPTTDNLVSLRAERNGAGMPVLGYGDMEELAFP